jgi:hypothetical protein
MVAFEGAWLAVIFPPAIARLVIVDWTPVPIPDPYMYSKKKLLCSWR